MKINLKVIGIVGTALAIIVAGGMTAGMNDAGYRTVVQYPTGHMKVQFEPGWYLKFFGTATEYPDALTYDFDRDAAGAGALLDSAGIPVQYGDGGMGTVFGTARVNLPNDKDTMLLLHREARGTRGVGFKVIKPTIDEAADKTAGLMNSEDGYATKRAIFTQWAREQAQKGIYETESKTVFETDEVTGKTVSRDIAVIKLADGKKQYQESAFARYGITIATFQMQKPDFEPKTMAQIAAKREATMAIITAKANAEKAKQDALTIEEQGKAELTRVEYEKLREKTAAIVAAEQKAEVAVIEAEQRVNVAAQAKLEAEQKKLQAVEYKEEQILIGEGDAERKRLVMEADGALEQKLAAYVDVNRIWASMAGKQKWVPEIMMGASGNANTNGATALMDLLATKAAKDLAVEVKPSVK